MTCSGRSFLPLPSAWKGFSSRHKPAQILQRFLLPHSTPETVKIEVQRGSRSVQVESEGEPWKAGAALRAAGSLSHHDRGPASSQLKREFCAVAGSRNSCNRPSGPDMGGGCSDSGGSETGKSVKATELGQWF